MKINITGKPKTGQRVGKNQLFMDPRIIYLFVFAALLFIAVFLQKRFCIICDATNAVSPKPYSYSRLQLLWWTFIILASFISTIIASGQIPTFDQSTLILLGIGSLTTASARIIDIGDDNNYKAAVTANAVNPANPAIPLPETLNKDKPSQGFWLDILSDNTGVSIHRFQAVIFNLVFGVWFIYRSVKYLHLKNIGIKSDPAFIDAVIPVITDRNLILLGLSAGTYAVLKSKENK